MRLYPCVISQVYGNGTFERGMSSAFVLDAERGI